jgi:hypothetical protein
LSADDLQDYIQDQVVFVYESSGARASGILAPTEGMVSYLRDTNQVSVYNGTAWVDIAPDVGTPGTYTKVTTDFKGRVTSGTTLAAGDIPALDSSKITTGSFGSDRITGNFGTDRISGYGSGTWSGAISTSSGITSGAITSNGLIISNAGITELGGAGISTPSGNILAGGTYNNNISSGAWRVMYVRNDGLYGYVPSSERFKQDIKNVSFTSEQVSFLQVVSYRYIDAVDKDGDEANVEIGLIAEDVAKVFPWLVDFDEDGKPYGVKYERLSLALLSVLNSQQSRLDSLEARLDRLEK